MSKFNFRLGDICNITSGQGAPQGDDNYCEYGTPFIKAGNLFDLVNGAKLNEIQCVSNDVIHSHRLKIHPAGSIVFAKSGASCLKGHVYVLDNDSCVVSHLAIVIPKSNNNCNSYYLGYYFRFNKPNSLVRDLAYPTISLSDLNDMNIVIPTIDEQNRIVTELDKIQGAIDNKRQQLAKLDELVNSKFYEMFGDPIANPKGWETKPYGNLFHLCAGGTPSKSNASYWDNGDISWIGSNLCQNTILYENDGKFITQLGFENSSAKLFSVGTVLVALVGATIGKTALLQFETTTNQNVLGIQNIAQAKYNSLFVFYYTQGLRKYFLEIGDGKFNMASKAFVSKLPMIVVDYNLQEKFAAFAQKMEQAKDIVSKQIDYLQELLDSRMDFYFRQ